MSKGAIMEMQELLAKAIGGDVAQILASELKGDFTKLYRLKKEDLIKLDGVSKKNADKIKALIDFSKAMYDKQRKNESVEIHNEETMVEYVRSKEAYNKDNYFMVIMLDGGYHFMEEKIFPNDGTIDMICDPREIFKRAIKIGSENIIFVHNIPNKNPRPSKADILRTQRIAKAGMLLGVSITDHVIFGKGKYYSMTYKEHMHYKKVLAAGEDITFLDLDKK